MHSVTIDCADTTLLAKQVAKGDVQMVIVSTRGPNNWPTVRISGDETKLRAFMSKFFGFSNDDYDQLRD